MSASFSVWDFKAIQNVCFPVSGIADFSEADKAYLDYVCLIFSEVDNTCTAYGCNGYSAAKITVPCMFSGEPNPAKLLIQKVKLPPKTERVTIIADDPEHARFIFTGKDGSAIGETVQYVHQSEPIDYAHTFKYSLDKVTQLGPEGRYRIGFNPRYLMNALSAFKDCDRVTLLFGDPIHPVFICPGGNNAPTAAEAMVLPVRIN